MPFSNFSSGAMLLLVEDNEALCFEGRCLDLVLDASLDEKIVFKLNSFFEMWSSFSVVDLRHDSKGGVARIGGKEGLGALFAFKVDAFVGEERLDELNLRSSSLVSFNSSSRRLDALMINSSILLQDEKSDHSEVEEKCEEWLQSSFR